MILNFRDSNFKTSEHFKKNETFEIKIVMKLKHYEIFFNDKTLPVYSTFPYRQPLGEATEVMVNLERVSESMTWLELHIPDLDLPGET